MFVNASPFLRVSFSKWSAALAKKAHSLGDAVMPAYTHLQRAEPVLVAHWLQAYMEMIVAGYLPPAWIAAIV